eukprot:1989723-Alexandrium_andersonii.AAC.1
MQAIPRSLADDISVSAVGPDHWAVLKRSGAATLLFLVRARARIAHHKSIALSTLACLLYTSPSPRD